MACGRAGLIGFGLRIGVEIGSSWSLDVEIVHKIGFDLLNFVFVTRPLSIDLHSAHRKTRTTEGKWDQSGCARVGVSR
jgi:hypothetical protein